MGTSLKPVILWSIVLLVAGAVGRAEAPRFRRRLVYRPAVVTEPGVVPIVVDLQTTKPFEGRIVIRLEGTADNGFRVEQKLNVGPGRFHFELPFPLTDSMTANDLVDVALVTRFGRRIDEEQPLRIRPLPRPEPGYKTFRRTSVAERPPTVVLLGVLADREIHLELPAGKQTVFECVSLTAADAPENWRMYEGLDFLLLAAGGARTMSPRQVDALHSWVRGGGRLVVDAEAWPAGFDDCAFAKAFGIQPPAPQVEALGLGYIAWADKDLLALARAEHGKQLTAFLEELRITRRNVSPPNPYGYHRGQNPPDWAHAMEAWTDLDQIPRSLVFLFLLVFALLVTVVEHVVLKLVKRLHWMWFTTAATVVLFGYLASYLSFVVRGRRSRLSSVVVHDYGAGGGRRTVLSCFIPGRSHTYAVRGAPDSRIYRQSFGHRTRNESVLSYQPEQMEFAHPVWASTFLVCSAVHTEDTPFDIQLTFDGKDKLTGTVTPLAPSRSFTSYVVYTGSQRYVSNNGQSWRLTQTYSEEEYNNLIHPRYYYAFQQMSPADGRRYLIENAPLLQLTRSGVTHDIPGSREYRRWLLVAVNDAGKSPMTVSDPEPITAELHIYRQLFSVTRIKEDTDDQDH